VIKFSGSNEKGEPICGLGLSQGNWDRLMAGLPIVLRPDEIGLPWKGEIFIMGGPTEQAMQDELSNLGVLDGVPVHTFYDVQLSGHDLATEATERNG
jgi:hypothetical protein